LFLVRGVVATVRFVRAKFCLGAKTQVIVFM
jgi:hypothetical protein